MVIGGKSPLYTFSGHPAVARRDRGRCALEVAETRETLWRRGVRPAASVRERRRHDDGEASGTGADNDAFPDGTCSVTNAAVLYTTLVTAETETSELTAGE